MDASRQQAIQVVFALLYGEARSARKRLNLQTPPSLLISLKKLLEADLARARALDRPLQPSDMAFYDELPAGSGHDVKYSPLRVFNLAVAHELTRFGGKQGEVAAFIAKLYDELKIAFGNANKGQTVLGHSKELFVETNEASSSLTENRERRKIFLVMRRVEATESAIAYFGGTVRLGERLCAKEILYGPEKLKTLLSEELRDGLYGAFVIELSELAIRVTELIQIAPLRKRGRPPSSAKWDDVLRQARLPERGHVR